MAWFYVMDRTYTYLYVFFACMYVLMIGYAIIILYSVYLHGELPIHSAVLPKAFSCIFQLL